MNLSMKLPIVYVVVFLLNGFASTKGFVGHVALVRNTHSSVRMSMKSSSNLDEATLNSLERIFNQEPAKGVSICEVESSLGMPWKSSICPEVSDDELLYMPFWEWQMSYMKKNLSNLRVQSCSDGKTDFSYNENSKKKARIVSLCASSDEYRKIRMTYYDAGDNTQVFNSVWYPDPSYNLPILGIDLLAFNRKKYLAIVDFQPLHEKERDHATTYEHILKPIKDKYESLKGRMSSKFYDETQFFSKEMLFARFDDETIIAKDLFPAFKAYVDAHFKLVLSTDAKPSDIDFVMERQKAYDTYSAERDPATGLFAAMFGGEWANDFVHNFLFSLSERKQSTSAQSERPVMGRPPQNSTPQPNKSKPRKHVEQEQVVQMQTRRA